MLILALILALLPPAAPPTPVRVVLVGAFTPAEQAEAVSRVERAVAFWEARAPQPAGAVVVTPPVLAVLPDSYPAWLADLGFHDEYTVYILNTPPYPFGPVHWHANFAQRYTVTTYNHPVSTEATLAHEIGHLLYNLPDLYPCGETDIMCNPASAYPDRLGCATLAHLGAPCQRVALPLLGTRL